MMNDSFKIEKKRFKIILIIFIILFFVVFFRLVQLTIIDNFKIKKNDKNYLANERGEILDCNYKKLALSLKVYSVFCNPLEVKLKDQNKFKILSKELNISTEKLNDILNSKKSFVWLKRQIDYPTLKNILNLNIEGIYTLQEFKRFYPNRRLGSHILGIVGVDNIGLEGLELYYDKYLNSGINFSKTKKNFNIILSIDKNIQYIVESELAKGVKFFKAKKGTAIILDPHTGYILAMANIPDFDPNNYSQFSLEVRKDISISDSFEPGSIFKIFSASTIYSEGVVKDSDRFYCDGYINIGDKKISCWEKHGLLNFHQVIQQSCNVGIIKAILRISPFKFFDYLRNFGIGNYTCIDLPGEAKGFLRNPKGMGAFSQGSISLGQEVSATPIQLLTAASAIFNDGKMLEPKIVKAIIENNGDIYKQFDPVIVRQVINPQVANKVAQDLLGVVEEGGTGKLAYIKNYLVAGKTGTGQIYDKKLKKYSTTKLNCSFIGFFPANNVKYAVLITVYEPQVPEDSGGLVAAPIFKNIIEKILAYKAIPDQNIINISSANDNILYHKEINHIVTERIPDFTNMNMKKVLKILKFYDVKFNFIGSGLAYKQFPMPNTKIQKNMLVTVWFK